MTDGSKAGLLTGAGRQRVHPPQLSPGALRPPLWLNKPGTTPLTSAALAPTGPKAKNPICYHNSTTPLSRSIPTPQAPR